MPTASTAITTSQALLVGFLAVVAEEAEGAEAEVVGLEERGPARGIEIFFSLVSLATLADRGKTMMMTIAMTPLVIAEARVHVR